MCMLRQFNELIMCTFCVFNTVHLKQFKFTVNWAAANCQEAIVWILLLSLAGVLVVNLGHIKVNCRTPESPRQLGTIKVLPQYQITKSYHSGAHTHVRMCLQMYIFQLLSAPNWSGDPYVLLDLLLSLKKHQLCSSCCFWCGFIS